MDRVDSKVLPRAWLVEARGNRFPAEQDGLYSRIAMGIAWPARRAGFVVVVGEHRMERVGGKPRLDVLSEATDERLWHVVEKAAALRFFYKPEIVVADTGHVAAMQFVEEFRGGGLRVAGSLLYAMDGPCAYAFAMLGRLIRTERLVIARTLSLAGEMMTPPPHEDLRRLLLSDYPGIAALALAVIELEQTRDDGLADRPSEADSGGKVLG